MRRIHTGNNGGIPERIPEENCGKFWNNISEISLKESWKETLHEFWKKKSL